MGTMSVTKRWVALAALVGLGNTLADGAWASPADLGRGLIALPQDGGSVYLGWRQTLCDGPDTEFQVFRRSGTDAFELLGTTADSTNYLDESAVTGETYDYRIQAITGELSEPESNVATVTASDTGRSYVAFPSGVAEPFERLVVGDLDGDHLMDYLVLWPQYPGDTEEYRLEAYLHDGTHLWTYHPGVGIISNESMHSSPVTAWDLDGDGDDEVILRTSKANAPHDFSDDYLTVLDGLTTEVVQEAKWVGPVSGGETNQMRNALAIAYLDGQSPSIIAGRGIYGTSRIAAFDTTLSQQWEVQLTSTVEGTGSHMLQVADYDGDGNDELFWGNVLIGEQGDVVWTAPNSTQYSGHVDLVFVTDIDPAVPGLELVLGDECWSTPPCANACIALYDVAQDPADGYVQRWSQCDLNDETEVGWVADVTTEHPGMEIWASGSAPDGQGGMTDGMHNAQGDLIEVGVNHWGWWPVRWNEDPPMLLVNANHLRNIQTGQDFWLPAGGGAFERGGVVADLFGDYREEIVRQAGGGSELRIFTNTAVATTRRVSSLFDRKYRGDLARTALQYERLVFEGGYTFEAQGCPEPPDDPDGGVPGDGGTGTDAGVDAGPAGPAGTAGEDSGCGCRAAGLSAASRWAGAWLLAVTGLLLVTRRRYRSKAPRS